MKVYAIQHNGHSDDIVRELDTPLDRLQWLASGTSSDGHPRSLVYDNEHGKKIILGPLGVEELFYTAYWPQTDPDDMLEESLTIRVDSLENTVKDFNRAQSLIYDELG